MSIVSTRAVVQAAGRRGVVPRTLLGPHGLDPATLDDPDARLPAAVVADLWQRAGAAANEPELPVYAAMELPWRSYRVLDYLAGSAGTVGEALGLVSRYFRIVHDAVRIPLAPDGEGAVLRIERPDGAVLPAPYVDYTLASCLYRMGYVSEGPVHAEIHLRRPAPADPAAHRQVFGPDVRFAAEVDEARIPPALWCRPTTAADPVLRDLLEAHARALIEQLSRAPDLLGDIRDAALTAMRTGRTDLGWIARRLGTSPRTLQRRLTTAHTTWRYLLETLRQEAASAYLRDPTLSVDDVAVLLGYAEASTFHRAFRRWTGHSPGSWRRTERKSDGA